MKKLKDDMAEDGKATAERIHKVLLRKNKRHNLRAVVYNYGFAFCELQPGRRHSQHAPVELGAEQRVCELRQQCAELSELFSQRPSGGADQPNDRPNVNFEKNILPSPYSLGF